MMQSQTIERHVRWYQQAFHHHMVNTPNARAIEIAHRRWGKDEIVMMAASEMAHKRIGTYWHCLPEYGQARKALWTAVNAHTGKRRIDEAFPPEIRANTNEGEMFIRLKCGSTWQLIGSDRFDSTVGSGPVFVGYSEWALCNPMAWAYHRPMVEENQGCAAFITTTRGKNHAYKMYNMAKDNPRWFAELSSVAHTKALTDEQLSDALAEYIALYGEDEGRATFEQEYYCSFNAALPGSYFGKDMLIAEEEGRIGHFPYNPRLPIHTAWDIGVADYTSIWFVQEDGKDVWVIDYYEVSGDGVEQIVKASLPELNPDTTEAAQRMIDIGRPEPFRYGTHYLPHDVKNREWGSGAKERSLILIEHGVKNINVGVATDPANRIAATRKILPRTHFNDTDRVRVGIDRLSAYSRKLNVQMNEYTGPLHDRNSHGADAFGEFAINCRIKPAKPEPKKKEFNVEDFALMLPPPPGMPERPPRSMR